MCQSPKNTTKLDSYSIIERMYRITTSNRKREQLWQRLFGRSDLPVLHAAPRLQELPGRTVLAYDLALQMLHAGDRARLAAHAAWRYGLDYEQARQTLDGELSWTIEDRGDLELVTVDLSPAFIFGNVLHLHDAGIIEFWRVRFIDSDGESM